MKSLIKEYVRTVLQEANLASLVSVGNKDDRGILISGQKLIVFSVREGQPSVDGYSMCHRAGGAWQVSFLWGRDARATVVTLLATLDNYKRLIVDTDMSPAALQTVENYYRSYKNDPKRIEVDAVEDADRPSGTVFSAVFLGPVGIDLEKKKKKGREMLEKLAAESEVDPDTFGDALLNIGSVNFRQDYNDDSKTRRRI